jgi:integrase/recombinase XerD
MANKKKANYLSDRRINLVLRYLETLKYDKRNKCIFLLSCKAGLRAKEISRLEWQNVMDDDQLRVGEKIDIYDNQSKGKSGGRIIYMNKELRRALQELYETHRIKPRLTNSIMLNYRGQRISANGIVKLFYSWFRELELVGYSSHSGRRTFITNMARTASLHGGSIQDVKRMAGHSSLGSTEAYIEINPEAQRAMVGAI